MDTPDRELREITEQRERERRVIRDPVAVFDVQAPGLEKIVKIVPASTLNLQTPDRRPLNDKDRQRLYENPEDFLVALSGRVFPINAPPPMYKGPAHERFKKEAPEKLEKQIIQNQQNTSLEACEQKQELLSQLKRLTEEAERRGQPIREGDVSRIGKLGFRSRSHTELETTEGESVWVDTGVMVQGPDGRWKENEIWYPPTKTERTPKGFPIPEPAPEIPVSTIITLAGRWQLAEEASEGKPTGRFWVRVRPFCQLPPRFEEEMGLWEITKASQNPYAPLALPANEYLVRREVIEKLESALSTNPA